MSRRFIISKKNNDCINHNLKFRNCAHHNNSHNYTTHVRYYNDITERNRLAISNIEMRRTLLVKIIFHIMGPSGTLNSERIKIRADEIISSINNDFNNYSANQHTLNNVRHRNIINQVFSSNVVKKNIYLSDDYLRLLPTEPAGIIFELGQIYYYPVRNRLNLTEFDDVKSIELQHQEIKRYIGENEAVSLYPEHYLNIWIIDTIGTCILGFSSFPWEMIDAYNGIVMNRRAFFPEDYGEGNYNLFKIFTHEIGHYLGLLHIFNNNNNTLLSTNINALSGNPINIAKNNGIVYDPLDRLNNTTLFHDNQYNPMFTNFMGYTFDKYLSTFTLPQIQRMRFMLFNYRPSLISQNKPCLPIPMYNPLTRTFNQSNTTLSNRIAPSVPSRESTNDPRLAAHGLTQASINPAIPRANAPITHTPNVFDNRYYGPHPIISKNYEQCLNMCGNNDYCPDSLCVSNLSGGSSTLAAMSGHALGAGPASQAQAVLKNNNILSLNPCISIDPKVNDYTTYFSNCGYGKLFACHSGDKCCENNGNISRSSCDGTIDPFSKFSNIPVPSEQSIEVNPWPPVNPYYQNYEEWKLNTFNNQEKIDDSSYDDVNESNIDVTVDEDSENIIESESGENDDDFQDYNEYVRPQQNNINNNINNAQGPILNNNQRSILHNARINNNIRRNRNHGPKRFIRTQPVDISL